MIRLHSQIVGDFEYGQRCSTGQKMREGTLMTRIEMLHEDESHARIEWQMLE
jgi:hypothetical protein